MELSFYKSFIAEEIRDEGRAEGEMRRAAKDVMTVLAARGIDVPDQARARITGCGDLDTLSRWLRRAAKAPSADDIFTDE